MSDDELARRFETARPRLRALASQLLGESAEADDAVQESWFRLRRAEPDLIENLDAWLTTVVSRICLDLLRSPRRRRERSWEVTPWPAETLDQQQVLDPADLVEESEQVNTALFVLLDTLTPAERIAFVLHDVFGCPFEEVALTLDRSPVAVRQLASRARRRLRGAPEPGQRTRGLVEAWLTAVQQGDLTRLLELLADDALLTADHGTSGQVLDGARAIAEQAVLLAELAAHSTPVLVDGRPGVVAELHGVIASIMVFEVEDDRITHLDVLADPARLRRA